MRDRYISQRDPSGDGWQVLDRTTGAVAETAGNPHAGLSMEDADEVAEMLNGVETRRKAVARKSGRFRLRSRERYYARQDPDGWAVYDSATGELAETGGSPQSGLSVEDADDLVDLLNRREAGRP